MSIRVRYPVKRAWGSVVSVGTKGLICILKWLTRMIQRYGLQPKPGSGAKDPKSIDCYLSDKRIRTENPHFVGDELSFDYFKSSDGFYCCDVTCIATWPGGVRKAAVASYQWVPDVCRWALIAN